jgi:hypothetical protein
MKYSMQYKMMSALCAFGVLSGCGTYVPDLQEFYQTPEEGRVLVQAIVSQVQCEVNNAVRVVYLEDMKLALDPHVIKALKTARLNPTRRLSWLDTWGAQVILTLTIEEKSALNPGLSLNTPIHNGAVNFVGETFPSSSSSAIAANTYSFLSVPQSYAFGLGGTLSSDATRKETLSLFIDFKQVIGDLAKQFVAGSLDTEKINKLLSDAAAPCPNENGIFIQSDLKLKEWLEDVTLPARVQDGFDYAGALAAEATASKKDVISHEVTFVIIYGGNITPTWKLVRVSANTGTVPLFGATRTNTQDLVITMGPPQSAGVNNTLLAAQIGQAVASAIRTTQ